MVALHVHCAQGAPSATARKYGPPICVGFSIAQRRTSPRAIPGPPCQRKSMPSIDKGDGRRGKLGEGEWHAPVSMSRGRQNPTTRMSPGKTGGANGGLTFVEEGVSYVHNPCSKNWIVIATAMVLTWWCFVLLAIVVLYWSPRAPCLYFRHRVVRHTLLRRRAILLPRGGHLIPKGLVNTGCRNLPTHLLT